MVRTETLNSGKYIRYLLFVTYEDTLYDKLPHLRTKVAKSVVKIRNILSVI